MDRVVNFARKELRVIDDSGLSRALAVRRERRGE